MKVLKRAVVWALRATGTGTAAVLAAVGVLAQPLALPVWIMLGAMVGAGIALHQNHRWGDASDRRGSLAVAAGTAGVLVIACLSLNGLAVLMGTGSWPVLLAVLLSTAAVWGWRRVHRRGEQEPPVTREAPPVEDGVAAASLEAMSTSELCLAWRRSYRALMDAPCGKVHDDMVIMRRTMLDEFERRDPQGLRRWLDDDARASSDPGRYLSPPASDI